MHCNRASVATQASDRARIARWCARDRRRATRATRVVRARGRTQAPALHGFGAW